jgi:diguanylate cyclase (GGDEF)-like protein
VAPGVEDSLSRVFISIVDITARKQAESLVRQHTAQAEAHTEISSALSAANLENEKIFHIIVERAANLIGDACVLTLLSEDMELMEVADFYNSDLAKIPLMGQLLPRNSKPFGGGVLCRAVRTRRTIFIPEHSAEEMPEIIDAGFEAYFEHYGVCSLLVFPLIAQGQVIGTLLVSRDHPGKSYTLEDQSFLQNLANQAALTLVNMRLHDLVEQQARSDPLTGLYNRRYFFDLSELEFSRSNRNKNPISMLMFDLDHFKKINDTYGHFLGDQVLRTVADRCRSSMRGADLIGRVGGDEFIILSTETDLVGACNLAERIRNCIAEAPVRINSLEIWLTASIGAATKTEKTPDVLALFKMADEAMYLAKKSGRNRVATLDDE